MENGKISLQKLPCGEFFFFFDLKALNLKEDNLPFYFLDAV